MKKSQLATLDDLQQIFNDYAKTNEGLWEANKSKLNKITSQQDKILGILENWEIENTVGTEQTRELRLKVDNHEERLEKLEAAKN